MAYAKKRTGKKYTKKPNKTFRKNVRGTARNVLSRGPFKKYNSVDPFPTGQFVKFTYTQSNVLYSGTGGIWGTEQVFRLNSIYDPDYTGSGHQPYGYDQMALLYKQYKVIGAMIEIDFMNPDQDGLLCGACIVMPQDSFSTTSAARDTLNEKPMCYTVNLNDSGKQRYKIKQYFPMHTLLGVTKEQFRVHLGVPYTAIFGTNPQDSPRLAVNVASIANATNAACTCRTTITYYTQVYERIALAQS